MSAEGKKKDVGGSIDHVTTIVLMYICSSRRCVKFHFKENLSLSLSLPPFLPPPLYFYNLGRHKKKDLEIESIVLKNA